MNEKSVYKLGASDGLWIGLAMSVCVFCMIFSVKIPFLSLVSLALIIATPYLAWRFLRKRWIDGEVPPTFSAVWLHGICIFLFGALIMAFTMYVSLRHLSPGWIENQLLTAAERLAMEPATAHHAKTIHAIIQQGQLPSPIDTSISMIWLVAFTGSVWSMIFSFILTRTGRFKALRSQNTNTETF